MNIDYSDSEVIEDSESVSVATNDKAHAWRICPIGKHFVRTHILHIPPSQEYPEGQVVTRRDAICLSALQGPEFANYGRLSLIRSITS